MSASAGVAVAGWSALVAVIMAVAILGLGSGNTFLLVVGGVTTRPEPHAAPSRNRYGVSRIGLTVGLLSTGLIGLRLRINRGEDPSGRPHHHGVPSRAIGRNHASRRACAHHERAVGRRPRPGRGATT